MIRSALFAAFAVVGCSQQPTELPPAQPAVASQVALAASEKTPVPTPEPATVPSPRAIPASPEPKPQPPQAKTPEPPAAPSVFEFPTDLAGKAVAKAVAPDRPALTPTERFGVSPRPRAVPARLLDPDATPKAKYALPPILPAKAVEVRPVPPRERVPFDLGLGADVVPAKPTFPVAAGITERAADLGKPPPLPILGRPFNERVSLDDPTAEFGHAAITAPPVKVVVAPTGFLKVAIPDPFELGEQIKPKVPPTADPGLAPVVVNPQRVK